MADACTVAFGDHESALVWCNDHGDCTCPRHEDSEPVMREVSAPSLFEPHGVCERLTDALCPLHGTVDLAELRRVIDKLREGHATRGARTIADRIEAALRGAPKEVHRG